MSADRRAPPGWRPSLGHEREPHVRSPPTRSANTVGIPDRKQRKKTAETAHKVYTTFSRYGDARGRRGGRPSSAALLLKAVQAEDDWSSPDTEVEATEQLDFSDRIAEMIAGMYDSTESSNVVLHSEAGLTLHAHRAVIAGWSRVLRDEVCHSDRRTLELPYEGAPAALESMLRSFYTGHVDVEVSEGGTATSLLAISLAYDVPALVTRLTALLDASRGREHWWGDLQEQLGEVHGDGSMDDVWRRAEQLGLKPADPVDSRTAERVRSGRLRINLRAEVAGVTAAMFNDSLSHATLDDHSSDTILSLPVDGRSPQEFRVHRSVLGYWSAVLRNKLLQQRAENAHGDALQAHGSCKVRLEFRLRGHSADAGGTREASVVEQLLCAFYTGLLHLKSTENAQELLQAAVAFEVPIVEHAARTWLMARTGQMDELTGNTEEPTVTNVLSLPPNEPAVQLTQGTGAGLLGLTGEQARAGAGAGFSTSANDDTTDGDTESHIENVYRRLDPSGHGLSLREVEDAICEIAPDLFTFDGAEEGRDQEVMLQTDGTMGHDHGIDFYKAAKGVWIIKSIKPGSTAASVPILKTGMQVLKMDDKKIDTDSGPAEADQLHRQLARKMASGKPVKLTLKASKSSRRDWSVEERRKALHWSYKAADEHDDGWISLRELEHFHDFLRYVCETFMEIQRVLDQMGVKLTFKNFQRACSIIPHTQGTREDFEELCQLPSAFAADAASTRDFVTWAIRTNAGQKSTRPATHHEFTFDQPGSHGITFVCRTDEERCVETAAIKSIQHGSTAEAHAGLRAGMILTSISSPALSAKQTKSERLLDWLSGDGVDADAVGQLKKGAPHRIKQLHNLERDRLREVCMKTGLLTKRSHNHIGWDGLCNLGFKAVDNLLKQLFSTTGSHPITLGFAAGRQNLLFPGKKRCEDTFRLLSRNGSFVSLRDVEEGLPSLFYHAAEDVELKTLMQAYRAADIRGDGGLSRDEFRKCIQFLVYFHNNACDFEQIEEATEDRRHTFEDFMQNSLKMGEHLTHDEAAIEFTNCAEEDMSQNEHAQDGQTVSYETFCTWLARRAALRMVSEAATPHRIHEVSHSGAAARTVQLTMPTKDRIRTEFDVRGGRITFEELKQKLSEDILVAVVAKLCPAAHKRRLARVVGCAQNAAFVQFEQENDPYRTFLSEEVIGFAQQILRYTIALDDVWDKVTQQVQHRQVRRPAGATAACCATSRRTGLGIKEVMSEPNFLQACNVSGYHISHNQAVQEFSDLSKGTDRVEFEDFCAWIVPKLQILPKQQIQTNIDESKFSEYSGGRDVISATQLRRLAGRQDAMLDAALAVCQSEQETFGKHAFHQVLQTLTFLDDRCTGVARLLASSADGHFDHVDVSSQLNMGDFRRCCDLVGHHMSDVEVSRHFGQFGLGPDGYVDAKDFYVWFAHQEIARALSSTRPETVGLPVLLLPPKSRMASVARGLADPINRCLTWDEVQRAAAELLPQFNFRDDILQVAFRLKIDKLTPGELVPAEEFAGLMIFVSRLFQWWAKLQDVKFPILRKTFWSVCLLIDSSIQREESTAYFDQIQALSNGVQRQMNKPDLCAWILNHTGTGSEQAVAQDTSGEQVAAPDADVNAAFDRYSEDGAIDYRNISKLLGDLYPNLHPHFKILAHRAASVNGKTRINRDSCIRLIRCIRHLKEFQEELRELYEDQMLFGPDTTDSSKISSVNMNKPLYEHAASLDKFEQFWADETPAAVDKQQTDHKRKYVTFGDFCCWLAQEQSSILQLSPRNNTSKSKSSLLALPNKKLYKLGMQYLQGEHPVPKNAESAVSCFRAAADRGHAVSQRVLGECLMAGKGVSRDPVQATHYYQLAAKQGDEIAQAHLGLCYLTGDGVGQDLEEAVRLFRAAGEDAVAQFNLGVCYAKGEGVSKDPAKAVECYEQAAHKGLVEAQCNLGECLMKGDGVPKDHSRAVQLFITAARRGLPSAQFNLGLCYSRGEGVDLDSAAALHYYHLAADRNHPRAKEALERTEHQVQMKEAATQYRNGKVLLDQWRQFEASDPRAQAEHFAECVRCFDSSSQLGNHDARYELASLYRAGEGDLERNDEKAYELAKPAADAHHPDAAYLCAQLKLVHWYITASTHGVFDEALYYFTIAAESEHHDAQFVLGYILLCQACEIDEELRSLAASMQHDFIGHDDHVSGDKGNSYYGAGSDLHDLNWAEILVIDVGSVEKSKHWFARATAGGNVQAMRMLAELYMHGCGVVQNDLEALDWFRLAAEHNDVVSLCKQAWLTIKGTACHQDFDEAERLFKDALKIDEDHLEAQLAVDYFANIKHCALRSRGDYTVFLQDLLESVPDVHNFALRIASQQMQAQQDQKILKYTHQPLLEKEIREEERKKYILSAQASELRERAGHLDAHRTQGPSDLPRHLVLISRRLPAFQLLSDSVRRYVATIECDEADDFDNILDQVRTTVADAGQTFFERQEGPDSGKRTEYRLDSLVLIHKSGELNELVPRLRDVCDELPVEQFDQDTWNVDRALLADRVDDYFDVNKHIIWRQAAEKHQLLDQDKILQAESRVNSAKEDARRAELKILEFEDKRQRELRTRRDQRKRRQEEHGVSRPWAEHHDPANAEFLDDDITNDAGPPLFGQPLLSCAREMSSHQGLDRLPRAIEVCAQYVRKLLGTTDTDVLVDLFKMPHNLDVIEKLTAKLDRGDLTIDELEQLELNVLDVAWVIVTWLKKLPQALLSTPSPGVDDEELFRRIQQVGAQDYDAFSDGGSEARAISDLKLILDQLPADHYMILAFIMQLLHDTETERAQRSDQGAHGAAMDAKGASLVLTPALVHRPAGSMSEKIRLNHRVVAVMIEHFDLVFWEQKLYPGTYSIEGHVSSIQARGILVLTDSHQVKGYLAVSPCIEQQETLHPASWMVRHIMDGGTWGMDGRISFTARSPLKNEFRITVVCAQKLKQLEPAVKEIAVRAVCDFDSHTLSNVTQLERIVWEHDEQLDVGGTRVTGSSAWESSAGECLSFVARTPPSSFRLRCLGEGSSGVEELMGEAVVELEECPSSAPAWARKLDVEIKNQGELAGSIQVVIEWDPARKYEYKFATDDNLDIRGECVEGLLNGQLLRGQDKRQDNTAEFTLSRALAQDAQYRIHAHGSWHYARIMAVSTVTDRRTTGMVLKEKQQRGSPVRRIIVHRLNDNEDGSKGAAEKAGVRVGDELLEVNGETVHALSKAEAIIMQRSGPGDFIELVFSREGGPLESEFPRSSTEQRAGSNRHESQVVTRQGRRRGLGGCCAARPSSD